MIKFEFIKTDTSDMLSQLAVEQNRLMETLTVENNMSNMDKKLNEFGYIYRIIRNLTLDICLSKIKKITLESGEELSDKKEIRSWLQDITQEQYNVINNSYQKQL